MYMIVKWCCGLVAALTTVAYLTANIVAASDGPRGIEMSPSATVIAVVAIAAAVVLAAMAWMVEEANHRSAHADIDPVVAAAVERGCKQLSAHIDEVLAEAAQSYHSTSIAGIRTVLEDGVYDQIESGLSRAQRYGMVREATSRVNAAASGTVTSIRQREGE